uniref:Uncharacterized protein n=1 Tax=Amphimedon queenslandica TaxID=400682 RepID=A0A1X7TGF8_AMPQE
MVPFKSIKGFHYHQHQNKINRRFHGGANGRTNVKLYWHNAEGPGWLSYGTVTPGPTPLGVNALSDLWRSQYK